MKKTKIIIEIEFPESFKIKSFREVIANILELGPEIEYSIYEQ